MKNKINIILNAILIIIFIYSSSKVFMYIKDGLDNKNLMKDMGIEVTVAKPTDEDSPLSFTKNIMNDRKEVVKTLQEKNSDVIGWIYIYDTKVDYPILQSKDNSYYLNHNVKKEYTPAGSIFMDYRNDPLAIDNSTDNNIVLYGHRMKNSQMFGTLKKFSNKEYFNSKYPIALILNDKEYYFEVFSSYITSSDDNYIQTKFDNKEEFNKFIEKVSNKSHSKVDTNKDLIDNILTLSTCSYEYEDARLVVHARLIKD